VFVVTIIVATLSGTLERLDNVLAPEEDTVEDEGANLTIVSSCREGDDLGTYRSVSHKHGVGKGAGQPGETNVQQTLFVEYSTLKDFSNWVSRAVLEEESSGHERKGLGTPSVAVVDAHHDDVADEESNGHMGLEGKRKRGVE